MTSSGTPRRRSQIGRLRRLALGDMADDLLTARRVAGAPGRFCLLPLAGSATVLAATERGMSPIPSLRLEPPRVGLAEASPGRS